MVLRAHSNLTCGKNIGNASNAKFTANYVGCLSQGKLNVLLELRPSGPCVTSGVTCSGTSTCLYNRFRLCAVFLTGESRINRSRSRSVVIVLFITVHKYTEDSGLTHELTLIRFWFFALYYVEGDKLCRRFSTRFKLDEWLGYILFLFPGQ